MRHVMVFQNGEGASAIDGLCARIADCSVSRLNLAPPRNVTYGPGVGVVVVWSARAAETIEPTRLPPASVVICMDETPMPPAFGKHATAISVNGDDGQLEAALDRAALIASGKAKQVLPVQAELVVRRSRPVHPVRRAKRSGNPALIASASAVGTLAAVAVGWTVPADLLAPDAVAHALTSEAEAGGFVVHESLARSHAVAATAAFGSVLKTDNLGVSPEELDRMRQDLAESAAAMQSYRDWSDAAIERLAVLSQGEQAPAAGAPGPEASLSQSARAAGAGQWSQAQAQPVGMRGRFTVLEPLSQPIDVVDRMQINQLSEAEPMRLQPLAPLPV